MFPFKDLHHSAILPSRRSAHLTARYAPTSPSSILWGKGINPSSDLGFPQIASLADFLPYDDDSPSPRMLLHPTRILLHRRWYVLANGPINPPIHTQRVPEAGLSRAICLHHMLSPDLLQVSLKVSCLLPTLQSPRLPKPPHCRKILKHLCCSLSVIYTTSTTPLSPPWILFKVPCPRSLLICSRLATPALLLPFLHSPQLPPPPSPPLCTSPQRSHWLMPAQGRL